MLFLFYFIFLHRNEPPLLYTKTYDLVINPNPMSPLYVRAKCMAPNIISF